MAQDIVPIELGLPQGDLVTLWAPRWREDGEEWEAFLGEGEDLYAFSDSAHLAAFIRTAEEHDLVDHPAWSVVPALNVPELIPDDDHSYDLVGVVELAADEPNSWAISELAEIVGIVRSLADVCDLEDVHEVLDAYEGFSLLEQGRLPFTGREGERLWNELSQAISEKWDTVLDAIDQLVMTPEIDNAAREQATEELAAYHEESAEAGAGVDTDAHESESDDDASGADSSHDEDPADGGFWAEVGIDPIKIILAEQEYYTLRCYLDDEPIFLGSEGTIEVYKSERTLIRALADANQNFTGTDLSQVATWDEVVAKGTAGELEIEVEHDNTYVLTGLEGDIGAGIDAIDPTQLELAVELLTDTAHWADDDSAAALAPSESLGWLVSYVLRPDPTRLAPSAPFDTEQEAWHELVESFTARLRSH